MPREVVRAPEHDRNRSLGWLAVAWMEHLTVHGPGDVEGEPVILDDELTEITVDCYALERTGRRLYDSAFISRPKGRDKSGHAGRHVLFEGFGPCRFAGFAEGGETYTFRDFVYEYRPDEPMGRPVNHPVIRCLATEEGQAGNTYDNVYYNLTDGPLAEGLPRDAAGLTRTNLPNGGEIIPSTASGAAKDGGKETFCVFDETHLMVLPELHRMYSVIRRNMAKRKSAEPWSLETSTMYLPGEDSVAEGTYKLAQAILEGKARRSRLLFDHREAPADVDFTDEAAVIAALREVYGPFSEVMDLDRILSEIYDPRNPLADSQRYFFNQRTSAADAWVADYEWTSRLDTTKTVAKGDVITVGFDGSRRRSRAVTDATALIGCRVSDGHLFSLGVWEQPDGPEGDNWRVPVGLVNAAVADAFKTYRVVGFYADPAKWESYVAGWEAAYAQKLKVKATRLNPIEWWMTGGRALHIVRALEQFHSAVIDGEMTHGGDYALSRHVLNARRRASTSGIQIAKEHPESPRKIDAAVAAVLAWQARLDALAAGLGAKTTGVPRRIR